MRPSWTSGPATPPVVFALLVASLLFLGITREVAAQIFMGGAHLYGFTESDFQKAAKAAGGSAAS